MKTEICVNCKFFKTGFEEYTRGVCEVSQATVLNTDSCGAYEGRLTASENIEILTNLRAHYLPSADGEK